MKTVKLWMFAAILLMAWAPRSEAVTIQAGAYVGRYYINGVGPYFGNQTIALAAGTYSLDTGAEIGVSAFTFDVDAGGGVGNVSPAAAASASGDTIAFNTTAITIHAGGYAGRYFLSIFGTAVDSPISAAGHSGQPWQESLVTAGFISVSVAIVASLVLVLWGLRASALQ